MGRQAPARAGGRAIRSPSWQDPPARPLAALGMASDGPGAACRGVDGVTAELAELRSSPGLYLFVPLLVLEALGPNLIAVGPFDTPLLLTPGTFATRTINPLTTLLCLLLLFYTVESLWRERRTGLAAISMATPVRTGSILLGKALANSVVGVAVVLLRVGHCGRRVLAVPGEGGIAVWPFAWSGGSCWCRRLLWTSFVMATLALTRNRYATYGIAWRCSSSRGTARSVGEINWVGNWPLWSAVAVERHQRPRDRPRPRSG